MYPDAPADELRRILEVAKADVLLVGHTHLPMDVTLPGGAVVANPGALLRDPAHPLGDLPLLFDGEKFAAAPSVEGGTFGILEPHTRHFTIHRAADGTELDRIEATPRS